MTVRTDLTVNFAVSPRIVTIASPSTTVTIQDLHDTLRSIEAKIENLSFLKLISSAGKEDLGGGVKVGVTTTLQNTKLAFAARSGPSYIQCTISGGNLVAVDANGNSISSIEPTAFTQVILAQSSSATIIQDVADWTQTEKDNHISTTSNIPASTWTQALSGITAAGSIGKRLIDVLKLKRTRP